MFGLKNSDLTPEQRIKSRRSSVRVFVTYAAAAYAFLGGLLLIYFALKVEMPTDEKAQNFVREQWQFAKDLFVTILPIATGVITYWFATRRTDNQEQSESVVEENEQDKGRDEGDVGNDEGIHDRGQ